MADPTDTDESTEEDPKPKNWRRDLEDRLAAAEGRATEAERRAAVAEAGLTGLNAKQNKALQAAHDGEWTSEAIKATAAELGFGAKVEQSTSTEVVEDKGDPVIKSEAAELSGLADSPQVQDRSSDPIRTQEAFDAKINSFETEAELDAWVAANRDLFPYFSTAPQ